MIHMEQHPVPQNVTTFQFRLVGDMTLKQFGYLGGGVLLAYISTKLPLPFFFTWPMTLFFGLGGFGLAFVPVEERPMDIWITSFLRNTYSPTQYVWQKASAGPHPAPAVRPVSHKSISPDPVSQFLALFSFAGKQSSALPSGTKASPILSRLYGEKQYMAPAGDAPAAQAHSLTVSGVRPFDLFAPLRSFFKKTASATPVSHVSFSHALDQFSLPPIVKKAPPIVPPATQVAVPPPAAPAVHPPAVPVQQAQTLRMAEDQQKLASQLADMKKEVKPVQFNAPAVSAQPTIHTIGLDAAVAAGLPKLTTFPNIVTGIVKDDRGGLLSGALVTVRDTNGTPLRALKTNKLGQFAAGTPLPNGTYLVEVEDPQRRYTFDRAQITVNGAILLALEIVAKSQKKIEREKLEKAIFGQTA